jgi:hypothetical protein
MITRRLWNELQTPPDDDPLAQRLIKPRVDFSQTGIWALLLGLVLMTDITEPAQLGERTIVITLVYFLVNAVLQSWVWAMNAADTIKTARSHQALDLLCVLPGGARHLYWVLLRGELHRDASLTQTLRYFRRIVYALYGTWAFLVYISAIVTGLDMTFRWALPSLLIMTVLLGAAFVNYMQSIVSGGILGLLITAHTRSGFDARLWLVLAVPVWTLGFYGLVAASLQLLPDSWLPRLAAFTVIVVGWLALREVATHFLWRWLLYILND